MQAGLRSGRVRQKNLEFRRSAKKDDALIGPTESHAAVRASPQSVVWVQNLVGLRKHPGCGTGGGDFHYALQLRDSDFICDFGDAGGLRVGQRSPGCEISKNRSYGNLPTACGKWVQFLSPSACCVPSLME